MGVESFVNGEVVSKIIFGMSCDYFVFCVWVVVVRIVEVGVWGFGYGG